MKGVIIGGGYKPSKELLKKELKDAEIIVCADSGAKVLYENGICPDVLLGDFDSLDGKILDFYKKNKAEIHVFPPEKDYTDSEIAFRLLAENKNIDVIVMLGCTGTRIDHVMGNIGILDRALKKGIKAYIKDENNVIMLIDRGGRIKNIFGKYVSFQAFGEPICNFSIKGAKYDLEDYVLSFGDHLTVSNEFKDEYMDISFEKGKVIVIYSKD